MTRTKADDEALSAKAPKVAATWRDLFASAESALSARSRGDTAHLAIQHAEIDQGYAMLKALDPKPAAPEPVQRPQKLSPADAETARACEVEERNLLRVGPGYRALRKIMPVLRKLAVW